VQRLDQTAEAQYLPPYAHLEYGRRPIPMQRDLATESLAHVSRENKRLVEENRMLRLRESCAARERELAEKRANELQSSVWTYREVLRATRHAAAKLDTTITIMGQSILQAAGTERKLRALLNRRRK
jgi:hypothetical protein